MSFTESKDYENSLTFEFLTDNTPFDLTTFINSDMFLNTDVNFDTESKNNFNSECSVNDSAETSSDQSLGNNPQNTLSTSFETETYYESPITVEQNSTVYTNMYNSLSEFLIQKSDADNTTESHPTVSFEPNSSDICKNFYRSNSNDILDPGDDPLHNINPTNLVSLSNNDHFDIDGSYPISSTPEPCLFPSSTVGNNFSFDTFHQSLNDDNVCELTLSASNTSSRNLCKNTRTTTNKVDKPRKNVGGNKSECLEKTSYIHSPALFEFEVKKNYVPFNFLVKHTEHDIANNQEAYHATLVSSIQAVDLLISKTEYTREEALFMELVLWITSIINTSVFFKGNSLKKLSKKESKKIKLELDNIKIKCDPKYIMYFNIKDELQMVRKNMVECTNPLGLQLAEIEHLTKKCGVLPLYGQRIITRGLYEELCLVRNIAVLSSTHALFYHIFGFLLPFNSKTSEDKYDKLKSEDLVNMMGKTRNHLDRTFKNLYGVTHLEYSKACEQILNQHPALLAKIRKAISISTMGNLFKSAENVAIFVQNCCIEFTDRAEHSEEYKSLNIYNIYCFDLNTNGVREKMVSSINNGKNMKTQHNCTVDHYNCDTLKSIIAEIELRDSIGAYDYDPKLSTDYYNKFQKNIFSIIEKNWDYKDHSTKALRLKILQRRLDFITQHISVPNRIVDKLLELNGIEFQKCMFSLAGEQ